jgi:predicted transcriptional regulator
MTADILALTKNCIKVKKLIPQMNLKALYSMSEEYVNLMQDKIWEEKS